LNSDAGITYLIKKNLQIDFSSGLGLNQKMNYFSIGCAGISVEIDCIIPDQRNFKIP